MKDGIIIAATSYTPEGGGAVNRFIDLQCKGLLEKGFSVQVISAYGNKFNIDLLSKNIKITQINQCLKISNSMPSSIKKIISYLFWSFFMLSKAIQNRQAAWIFYGAALSFAFAIPWTRLLGGKTCYLEADLPWGIHNPIEGSPLKWSRKVSTKIALIIMARSVHHILLGGTGQLIAYFKKLAPHAQITQSWPPANVALFASGNQQKARTLFNINKNAFLIVYAGSVCAREGIHTLLEAFAIFSKNADGSHLFIAGDIPPSGHHAWLDYGFINLKEMSKKLGISENVVWGGMLKKNELIDILKAADLLVMPKAKHIYNFVALPIKVGEYLATANPVISSKIGDIDKFLVDNESVILVKPDDPVSLSEKLLWVYRNKKKSREIGERGFEIANKFFNYTSWVKTYLEIIQQRPY